MASCVFVFLQILHAWRLIKFYSTELLLNKESHWLQVSVTKLRGDSSDNIKMPDWFLDETCKKVQNRKCEREHHYNILQAEISLATRFRLKLTVLNFWIKLTQKGYF